MENKDKPAYPFQTRTPYDSESEAGYIGLTKRELFAKDILAGIVSKYTLHNPGDQQTVTQLSIELADELLKQLEKK